MYTIRVFFEWSGGCLWAGNEAARERFDSGPIEDRLPISDEIRDRLRSLSEHHDTALNWSNPLDPGPWSAQDLDAFECDALAVKSQLQEELGSEYAIVYVPNP